MTNLALNLIHGLAVSDWQLIV